MDVSFVLVVVVAFAVVVVVDADVVDVVFFCVFTLMDDFAQLMDE